MSIYKILASFLVISFVSLCFVNFNLFVLAQTETTFDNTASTEAVTSINDAILKSFVIISQVAVLGIVFNYFFFSRFLSKKRGISSNILNESKEQNIYYYSRTLKKVSSIVILCCISIIIFSTCIILLQSYQLSQNLDLDLYSAFDILFTTSVGQVWLLRIVTSLVIIAMMIISYFVFRIGGKTNQGNNDDSNKITSSKTHNFRNNKLNQMFIFIVMVLASINLFSNSMVSHSNSLSSLSTFAVPMDWIHFMAVSVWIGGLFYLSIILLKNLKPVDYDDTKSNSINPLSDISNNIMSVHSISISLMNFSFIVIIALCVIGISGLYLGYIHLQDLNSVFNTSYGQILILKLALAFPLIFIGRYNQLKIYKYTSLVANLVKNLGNNTTYEGISNQYRENRIKLFRRLNTSLKIESLLGITVLIVASFLSVTSPPSLEAINQVSTTIQDKGVNDSGSAFFFYLVISLVVIISAFGIVNFKKNQQQIKKILAITGGSG